MQKLANAADDAKQIIGEGLLDALKGLGEDNSVQNLSTSMQNFATETANVIRGIGKLIEKIQALDDKVPDWLKFDVGMVPIVGSWYKIASAAGKVAAVQKASDNQHLQSLQQQYKIDTKISKISTKLTADQLKKLKAKKLEQAIDKANLALNKGEEVFDIDKIQIAAALTNQAQLLGQANNAAQILQIANDTARLNVKRSILALEDAIASKDEAAIVAATAKLNEDLKILNALSNQKTQMVAIESILKGLTPKDLINQNNLDEALRKIREMLALLAQVKTPTITAPTTGRDLSTPAAVAAITAKLPASVTTSDFFNSLTADEQAQLGGYQPFVGAKIPTTMPYDSGGSGAGLGNTGSGRQVPVQANYSITVNAGVGDPEAIARTLEDYIRQSYQRGTSSTGLLAV
jgi:hypothetical protein